MRIWVPLSTETVPGAPATSMLVAPGATVWSGETMTTSLPWKSSGEVVLPAGAMTSAYSLPETDQPSGTSPGEIGLGVGPWSKGTRATAAGCAEAPAPPAPGTAIRVWVGSAPSWG